MFKYILFFLINFLPLLVAIAFFTLLERKIIAAVQRRKGPNMVGFWGLLQPVADGLKLLSQEQVFPKTANKFFFLVAPCFVFFSSMSYWIVIPSAFGSLLDFELSLLYVQTVSSLSVYGVFLAGLSSNSKYAVMGSLRAVSQYVSFELCSGICFLYVCLISRSANLGDIVFVQSFCGDFWRMGWVFAIGFFISVLAETNRTPFDISEAESEVVAGFHTEFSSTGFGLFFLGEYCNILVFSSILVILFFGGWSTLIFPFGRLSWGYILWWIPFVLNFIYAVKVVIFCVIIIMIRAYLPRLRFDQSMELSWKFLIPFLFGVFFIFCAGVFFPEIFKVVFFVIFMLLEFQLICMLDEALNA